MKKALPLILFACTLTASAPAAAASGSANCAGMIASAGTGAPAFVADLIAGFGRMFGYLISNNCDIPED